MWTNAHGKKKKKKENKKKEKKKEKKENPNKTKPQPVLHKMYWRIKGYSGFQCYKILLSFFFRHILYFLSAVMSLKQRGP